MKKGLIGAGVVVLILIIGGAIATQRGKEAPVRLLEDMREQMAQVQSISFEGTVQIEGQTTAAIPGADGFQAFLGGGAEEQKTTTGSATISLSGVMAGLDQEEKLGEFMIEVDFETPDGSGEAGIAVKNISETERYVQLSALSLPPSEDSESLDLIFNQLIGEWITIQPSDDLLEPEVEEESTQPQLRDLVQNDLITLSLTNSTQKVRGEQTHRVTMAPNVDAIRDFSLAEYERTYGTPMPAEERADLEDGLAAINDLTGDIWVGASDSLVYKVALEGPIDHPDGTVGTIDAEIELFDHNKAVVIEAPTEVLSMEELIQRIVASMFATGSFPALPTPVQ